MKGVRNLLLAFRRIQMLNRLFLTALVSSFSLLVLLYYWPAGESMG